MFHGGKIFLAGGCGQRPRACYSAVEVLDTETVTWRRFPGSARAFPSRKEFALNALGGLLVAFGGEGLDRAPKGGVLVFNTGDPCPDRCGGNGRCL